MSIHFGYPTGRRRDPDDERFGDLVYEAWRSGRNPDLVDRDRYDAARAAGTYPDEITLRHVLPKARTDYPDEPEED